MDYHKKENIKWLLSVIIILVGFLLIAGFADEYEEKKHDKAFHEGYEEALHEYNINK